MKQVMISKGAAVVTEVPAPGAGPGEVLVRVRVSCLSVGTELSGLRASAAPLWKRAMDRPAKVVETARMALTRGPAFAWNFVRERTEKATATGYSAAGEVVAVGPDVDDLAVGDRVACAGGGYACHAEFIRVPRNLCVPVPAGLDWDAAATVTLGAIALQGVRRAQPTLGETFVVIGLGVLGQLTVQALRANGCRVVAMDLDPARVALAEQAGAIAGPVGDDAGSLSTVAQLTDGLGADGVIITAASPSDSIVSQAFRLCRKKGRVVLVGDVGLALNRADFYAKEIDFLISTSYGPGRYDYAYEERGLDYPAAYVRWTENRNMGEYLRLVADGRIELGPLGIDRYPLEDAPAAYAASRSGENPALFVLLTYDDDDDAPPAATVAVTPRAKAKAGRIRIAVVGAGAFACSTHLPNLRSLPARFDIHSVVARSGHTAASVAKRFGAAHASTDFEATISDPDVDAVLITTRHDQHARMALAALRAGKHVLVEKPMVLSAAELEAFDAYVAGAAPGEGPVLLTGYNRRFSPYAQRMASLVAGRHSPFMIDYRMNAGHVAPDHWVHGPEGGGRNLGEACHIYDLFTYLAGAPVESVSARAIRPTGDNYRRTDNFVASVRFADGSLAALTYSAMGSRDFPKESAELHVGGVTAHLDDYRALKIHGGSGSLAARVQDKGHLAELVAFADAINGGAWPIEWWQQRQAAAIALSVEDGLKE